MYKHLYDIFKHWYHGGSIYFYSDPHFGDLESYILRGFIIKNKDGTYSKTSFPNVKEDLFSITQTIKDDLDQMQIDNINKVCNEKDTIIILGDVGDIDCVRKLKAGHKVLIMGNHDKGATNYIKINYKETFYNNSLHPFYDMNGDIIKGYYPTSKEEAIKKYKEKYPNNFDIKCVKHNSGYDCYEDWTITGNNGLFDEVYEGTLQISPKIILSHEPVDYPYCLNIHGHVHQVNPFGAYTEGVINPRYNCVAEQINYKPVCINTFIDSGILKNIPDIHREVIEERKQ